MGNLVWEVWTGLKIGSIEVKLEDLPKSSFCSMHRQWDNLFETSLGFEIVCFGMRDLVRISFLNQIIQHHRSQIRR